MTSESVSDLRPASALTSRVVSALAVMFNFLLLNFALLVTSALVVTIPVAVNATVVALDRWRRDGEDRVLREYLTALRSSAPLSTTASIGAPLVAIALGVTEVHYFLRVHDIVGQVCLGMGMAGLVVALTSLGYVLLVVARGAPQAASDIWVLCTRIAVRNLFVTGPVFLIEIVVVTMSSVIDPVFVVFGSPLALVALMRLTAAWGLRRVNEAAPVASTAVVATSEPIVRGMHVDAEDTPGGQPEHDFH